MELCKQVWGTLTLKGPQATAGLDVSEVWGKADEVHLCHSASGLTIPSVSPFTYPWKGENTYLVFVKLTSDVQDTVILR